MSVQPTMVSPKVPGWIIALGTDGRVSEDTLLTALRENDQDPRRAGEWLVDHGCVARRDLVVAQAESHGLAFIEPGDYRINLKNRTLIPEEMARTRNVFPVFACERIITLAVAWPLELTVLDQIRLHTGCEVDQCLASPRELHHLIEWAYGSFQEQAKTKSPEAFAWEDILKDVADAPAVRLVEASWGPIPPRARGPWQAEH